MVQNASQRQGMSSVARFLQTLRSAASAQPLVAAVAEAQPELFPGFQKPEIVSRIVMTPYHAKRFLLALQDNMIKYESAFGDVDLEAANPRQKGTFNFNDFGKNGNGENKS